MELGYHQTARAADWTFYSLYVILDVFSRFVVGWLIAYRETAELAHSVSSSIPAANPTSRQASSPFMPIRYRALPIDQETADLAADMRREHGWRVPDAFQAALANIHGLKLVTRNTRDFPPATIDFVVVPYQL